MFATTFYYLVLHFQFNVFHLIAQNIEFPGDWSFWKQFYAMFFATDVRRRVYLVALCSSIRAQCTLIEVLLRLTMASRGNIFTMRKDQKHWKLLITFVKFCEFFCRLLKTHTQFSARSAWCRIFFVRHTRQRAHNGRRRELDGFCQQ